MFHIAFFILYYLFLLSNVFLLYRLYFWFFLAQKLNH